MFSEIAVRIIYSSKKACNFIKKRPLVAASAFSNASQAQKFMLQ